MVFVEGGTFTMGCDEQIGDCSASEKPVHAVTLTQDFWIGKYEVTRALWLAVMAGHPTLSNSGNWRDDDQLPIEKVSYYDVIGSDGFFARLNAQTGKKYRLPTEAEWEYVARGGKHKSPYKYSGSNDLNEVGWYTGNSGGKTHVVGGKKPNALGVYDMSGNVWEYCSDWHGTYPSDAQTNPTGPESGTQVILRGGYINCSVISGRVTIRGNPLPTAGNNDHGFRVVLPAQ
jgi:formylglycine-generating enzyme required for sulfatase activity